MGWLLRYKFVFFYGTALAMLLFILSWLELKLVMRDHAFAIYTAAICIIFTVLGIWLAIQLVKPKVETKIIEKEIVVEKEIFIRVDSNTVNQREINKLGISKRELDVLNLIGAGLSNDEIADKLCVSLNTVKTHSSNLFLKLDVKRRTQAVEKAKRLNIIQ